MGNFDHFACKPSYLVGTPSAAKRYSPRVAQIHVIQAWHTVPYGIYIYLSIYLLVFTWEVLDCSLGLKDESRQEGGDQTKGWYWNGQKNYFQDNSKTISAYGSVHSSGHHTQFFDFDLFFTPLVFGHGPEALRCLRSGGRSLTSSAAYTPSFAAWVLQHHLVAGGTGSTILDVFSLGAYPPKSGFGQFIFSGIYTVKLLLNIYIYINLYVNKGLNS